MGTSVQDKVYVTSAKGINTEASVINFPEDYVKDQENFIISRSGSLHKRLGLTLEEGSTGTPVYQPVANARPYEEGVVQTYVWDNVGNHDNLSILVLQQGSLLTFYQHNTDIIGDAKLFTYINLDEHIARNSNYSTASADLCDFAVGYGYLYVVSPSIEPFYMEITKDFKAKSFDSIDLKVRDFIGRPEPGIAIDKRPKILTDSHKYNLLNQGWESKDPNHESDHYIDKFKNDSRFGKFYAGGSLGVYPSNADIMYFGLRPDTDVTSGGATDTFVPQAIVDIRLGNTPAPKGHYIYSSLTSSVTYDTIELESLSYNTVNTLTGTTYDIYLEVTASGRDFTVDEIKVGDYVSLQDLETTTKTQRTALVGYELVCTNTSAQSITSGSFEVISVAGDTLKVDMRLSTSDASSEYNSRCTGPTKVYTYSGGVLSFDNKNVTLNGTGTINDAFARPETIAFSNGRAFYSGLNNTKNSSWVFFSRVLEDPSWSGDCYQVADPTSEDISDLVATDGGYIPIPEAGKIIKLLSTGSSIVVFATKGIWTISGRDTPFSATDYEIYKVSDVVLVGKKSIIDLEGIPIFWGDTGVFALVTDKVSQNMAAQSLSLDTIQTIYDDISLSDKKNAVAVYDKLDDRVFWLYKSESNGNSIKANFDMILVWDNYLKAFYKVRLPNNHPLTIASMFLPSPEYRSALTLGVFDEDFQVIIIDENGDEVVVDLDVEINADGVFGLYFLAAREESYSSGGVGNIGYVATFATINDASYFDWQNYDTVGMDYSAYVVTGFELLGDLMRQKQVQWLYTYFELSESVFNGDSWNVDDEVSSACKATVFFNWSNGSFGQDSFVIDEVYNKEPFLVGLADDEGETITSYNSGFPIVYSRNKIQGAGKAIQYKFESKAGEDCRLSRLDSPLLSQHQRMITWEPMVWEEDAEDVKRLAQIQWDKLALASMGELDMDMDLLLQLYDHSAFVGITGKDEGGEVVGYFVGIVDPHVYQKGKFILNQLSAIVGGDMRDYINMVNIIEREAVLMGADVISIDIESTRAGEIMKNRKGYEFNSCTLLKRVK